MADQTAGWKPFHLDEIETGNIDLIPMEVPAALTKTDCIDEGLDPALSPSRRQSAVADRIVRSLSWVLEKIVAEVAADGHTVRLRDMMVVETPTVVWHLDAAYQLLTTQPKAIAALTDAEVVRERADLVQAVWAGAFGDQAKEYRTDDLDDVLDAVWSIDKSKLKELQRLSELLSGLIDPLSRFAAENCGLEIPPYADEASG